MLDAPVPQLGASIPAVVEQVIVEPLPEGSAVDPTDMIELDEEKEEVEEKEVLEMLHESIDRFEHFDFLHVLHGWARMELRFRVRGTRAPPSRFSWKNIVEAPVPQITVELVMGIVQHFVPSPTPQILGISWQAVHTTRPSRALSVASLA